MPGNKKHSHFHPKRKRSHKARPHSALAKGERYEEMYGTRTGRVAAAKKDGVVLPPPMAETKMGYPAAPKMFSDCPDPNCSLCRTTPEKEPKELSKYYTGCRVSVLGFGPRRKRGTIINLGDEMPSGKVAVCLDEAVGPDVQAYELEELTKPGFGVFVNKDAFQILEDQCSYEAFVGVPSHIGVVVTEDIRVDRVIFKSGQTGRLIAQPQGVSERVLVNWNFQNPDFFDGGRACGIVSGQEARCYNVPRSILAFCRIGSKMRAAVIWPNSDGANESNFKKGDYVRILVPEPQRINDGQRSYRLAAGTLAQFQGSHDRYKSRVVLAGGCDPAVIGLEVLTSTRGLEKMEGDFIEAGVEVIVSTTLNFRRRDLEGLAAVVILPMDQDGEIGLQFKEDIGAGSLDGHGHGKRCLYIHHSSVKRASG